MSNAIRVVNNVSMSEDFKSDIESTDSMLVNDEPITSNSDNWQVVNYMKRLDTPTILLSGQAKI